jgi:hypothetical protein
VLNLLDKIYVLGKLCFARLWWGACPVWACAQQPFCDGLLLVNFAPRLGLWCWSKAHSTTVRCFACLSAHCLCSDACAGQVVCLRCLSSWTCAQHNFARCWLFVCDDIFRLASEVLNRGFDFLKSDTYSGLTTLWWFCKASLCKTEENIFLIHPCMQTYAGNQLLV